MKRGRPPLAAGDTSVHVHFRLPGKEYDRAQQRADAARLTLGEWYRQAVARACREPGAGKPGRRRV